MHKKFEINRTNIKGGCLLGRKVVAHNSKSDLPLVEGDAKMYVLTCLYITTTTNILEANHS